MRTRLPAIAVAVLMIIGAGPATAAPSVPPEPPNYGWDDVERPAAPGPYGIESLSGVWSDGVNVWAVGATSEEDGVPPVVLPWGVRCSPASCELLDLVPVVDPMHTNVSANDVGGTSATDVWVVGQAALGEPGDPSQRFFPMIQHFDGTSWTLVETNQPNTDLQSVAAIAPDDVWIMGCRNFCAWDAEIVLLHWDGTTWSDRSAELPAEYAFGGSYEQPDLLAHEGRLFLPIGGHLLVREAGVWSVALDQTDVRGVAQVGNRVWAVGRTDVWRERRQGWRQLPSPGAVHGHFTTITGTDARHVWVGGNSSDYANTPAWVVRRWDGDRWAIVPAPQDGLWTDWYSHYALLDSAIGPRGRPWMAGAVGDECDCGVASVLRRGPRTPPSP